MALSIETLKSCHQESVVMHRNAKVGLAELKELREIVLASQKAPDVKRKHIKRIDKQIADMDNLEFVSEGNIWHFGTQLEREGVAV